MANMNSYYYYKHLNRCVICGKRDAFTINGRSYCADCCEKIKKHKNIHYLKNKDKLSEKRKSLYYYRKQNHICITCGKPFTEEDDKKYAQCKKCRAKGKIRARNKRQENGFYDNSYSGLCTQCRKKPPLKDKKVCEDCYPKMRESILRARQFAIKSNYFSQEVKNQWTIWNSQKARIE